MTFQIRKTSNSLGAEVTGIDLRRSLADRDFDRILSAWHEHLLLVFRDQELDYPDYIRFGRRFGELERYLHQNKDYTHPEHPEIYFLTNREVNGKPSETRDVGREWHTCTSHGAYGGAGDAVRICGGGGALLKLSVTVPQITFRSRNPCISSAL